MAKRFKYLFIGLCFLMIIATCFGCTNSKNSNIQDSAVNYLKEQAYNVQGSADKDGFTVKGEKENSTISIECSDLQSSNPKITITLNNAIDGYSQKYKSIDYSELSKLAEILNINNIDEGVIKKACEDKRTCYDTSNADYTLDDNKIMSKIYRIGIDENPVIEYDLYSKNDSVKISSNI